MFLNEQTILEYSIMTAFTSNVFISNDDLVDSCGALASFKSDMAEGAIRPEDEERFATFGDDDGLIFVAPYLAVALSTDELGAIIAHEQGHIDLGHLEKYKGVKEVVDDAGVELEADAHAVSLFGARAVRAALGKTLSVIIAEMANRYSIPKGDQFKIYKKAVSSLKPRLDAIRTAM